MKTSSTIKNWFIQFITFSSIFLLPATVDAQWVQKADGIVTRSEVPSVVYNGKLYAFMGFKNSSLEVESTSEVYDPATNKWTLLAPIPTGKAMTHQGVALIDNTVWHIGGRVGKNPGTLTSEIWIYNISKNSWSLGPKLLDPATGSSLLWAGGGAALLGRTLHVFGGFVANACNNDQDKYHLTLDVDQWLANPTKPAPWKNELAPLPIKRNHFSTVVLGGKIYAIGGQFGHDCGGGQDKSYSHVYNPATKAWSELTQMPTARSHAEGSSFAIDGKIYVVAGQAASNVSTNRVTIFNPASNSGKGAWSDDTNLKLPRSYEGLSSKVINSLFLISHGGEGASQNVRKYTYTRTLNRTPVYKFGFLPACSNLTVSAGSSAKARTLLFTIDGSKGYSLTSNASWLSVSKNASGIAIQNAVDIEVTANAAGLAPGNYSAIVTATGTGTGPTYTTAQYCVNLTVSGSTSTSVLEAENAQLYRVVVAKNHSGYTGTGFADYINNSGDYIEWTVSQSSAGAATLQVRYANGSTADRPLKLEVNGVVVSSRLPFPKTGSWTKWSTTSVTTNLKAGSNKVRLTAIGYSGANLDHLKVSTGTTSMSIEASSLREPSIATPESKKEFSVSVAPNPASGMVKLFWNNVSNGPVEVHITDASGVIRRSFVVKTSNNNQFDFSVSDLPAGLYFVFVRQEKEQASTKLLVKRN